MAFQNNTITAPISIYDLQRCFARTYSDLGYLIISANINKWAKYKPVIYPTVKLITAEQLAEANFGISNIPTWPRLDYMAEFLCSDNRGGLNQSRWPECDQAAGSLSLEYWAYTKPAGGASEPFRLADFNNYYHLAEEPLGPINGNVINIEPTGALHIQFTKGVITTNTLKYSDLVWPGSTQYPVADMYYGCIMQQVTGGLAGTAMAVIGKVQGQYITVGTAANHQFRIDIDSDLITQNFAGTWKIFPLFSSAAFDLTSDFNQYTGGKFMTPLPDIVQPLTINIKYAEILITSHNGYKDSTRQQRYARFVFSLRSTETTPNLPRNYSITVTLRYSDGTPISGYTGRTTGQIITNATGTATDSATVNIYIANIWNDRIYYTAELVITDNLKFKRASSVSLTGPIQEQSPQQQ